MCFKMNICMVVFPCLINVRRIMDIFSLPFRQITNVSLIKIKKKEQCWVTHVSQEEWWNNNLPNCIIQYPHLPFHPLNHRKPIQKNMLAKSAFDSCLWLFSTTIIFHMVVFWESKNQSNTSASKLWLFNFFLEQVVHLSAQCLAVTEMTVGNYHVMLFLISPNEGRGPQHDSNWSL